MTNRFTITRSNFTVLLVLVSIIIIGIMRVPFVDRRFIIYAVLLELSYISLAVLVAKGHRKPCMLVSRLPY